MKLAERRFLGRIDEPGDAHRRHWRLQHTSLWRSVLLDRSGKGIAAFQYALGRKLIQQCGDRALNYVLLFRAARSGPRGNRRVWLVHVCRCRIIERQPEGRATLSV